MKKATMIIWVIISLLIALLFYQNSEFFINTEESLSLNLGVMKLPSTPELQVWIYFLIFFFLGIAIAYLFNFSARFRSRRIIKKLNNTIESHKKEVAELKDRIDSFKGSESKAVYQASEIKSEPYASKEISGERPIGSPAEEKCPEPADNQTSKPAENATVNSSIKNQ